MNNSKGISFIELIFSLSVMTALSAIALSTYTTFLDNARNAQARAMVKDIGTACETLTNDWTQDPTLANSKYNLNARLDLSGNYFFPGMTGCFGSETCAKDKLQTVGVTNDVLTGYTISSRGSNIEFSGGTIMMSTSFSGSVDESMYGLNCVGIAKHAKTDTVYYWIPNLALYSMERVGPATWCRFVPPGFLGC